jgi:hypothetical protein
MTGRVVSIRWVRTCFSKSRPFSAGSDLTKCCSAGSQNALKMHDEEIAEQMGLDALGVPADVILLEAAPASR